MRGSGSSPGTRAMLGTRGQLRRWPRRRDSREEEEGEGMRRAGILNVREKDERSRSEEGSPESEGRGGWVRRREGP